jgi:hypothetical protein
MLVIASLSCLFPLLLYGPIVGIVQRHKSRFILPAEGQHPPGGGINLPKIAKSIDLGTVINREHSPNTLLKVQCNQQQRIGIHQSHLALS